MKFISWNVNGFRAVLRKGSRFLMNSMLIFLSSRNHDAGRSTDFHPEGYADIKLCGEKGFTQELRFCKERPIKCRVRNQWKHNDEGRVITLEYDDFYLICAYVPNAQNERIDYRMEYKRMTCELILG